MQINIVVNCQDVQTAQKRLEVARTLSPEGIVHVDIADGTFTEGYKTWNDPAALKVLLGQTKMRAAVHLMVARPDPVLDAWLNAGISRIIVHHETISDPTFFVAQCRAQGVEVYLGVSPKTDMTKALEDAVHFDGALVLAVNPGLSGQQFQAGALSQIEKIHNGLPHLPVAVDGGVTPEIARRCKAVGATQIAVGAHIFNAPDPAAAYQEFVRAIAD